ncbi:MAG TPA: STAS domain-containing protein [Steroidobacteraceae bacterium]|jgi:rsbT co-antagonist protein RsbR|nr:STAS domain-containing protein [Steroidobacteraceae bacterium]
MPPQSSLGAVLRKRRDTIMAQWTQEQQREIGAARSRVSAAELTRQSAQFLDLLVQAAQRANVEDISGDDWKEIREFLDALSRERVLAGFASDETATFIFSLKRPLFDALRGESGNDADKLAGDVWAATVLLDKLGLHTVKSFQRSREEVINRQQHEMLELSTPVVKLWDGILALPMIGTLDSARTQIVMESLLQKIVETESQIAIVDITGVPTVDTLVAQHLLKTVTALRLMGADCIISGVRPQIAQTIVHLGVDLQGVITKANLADALALALRRSGVEFTKK